VPGTEAEGLTMCDPFSLIGGVASKALAPRGQGSASPAAADPEAERMKAEADATTSANLRLAASQRRRRQQQSLLAGGAPALGEDAATGDSPLSRTQTLRKNLAPAGSLMSRGSAPSY
jgi:hypothetical protein